MSSTMERPSKTTDRLLAHLGLLEDVDDDDLWPSHIRSSTGHRAGDGPSAADPQAAISCRYASTSPILHLVRDRSRL